MWGAGRGQRKGTGAGESNRVEDDGADAAGGKGGGAREAGGAASDDGHGGLVGHGRGEHHLLLVEALLDGRPPREARLAAPLRCRPRPAGGGHHPGEADRREEEEGRRRHRGCSTKRGGGSSSSNPGPLSVY
jgi:hypothetical protein